MAHMIMNELCRNRRARAARAFLAGASLVCGWLAGCGDSGGNIITGSHHVVSKTTPTAVIEKVTIWLPFKAIIHNGTARKIVIQGEDNLVAEIDVKEVAVSDWQLTAPEGLKFEQHNDLQISIPFIDMVEISYDGPLVFADQPLEARKQAPGDAGVP